MKCKNYIFQAWIVTNLIVGLGKSWKMKVMFGRLVAVDLAKQFQCKLETRN